MTLMVPQFMVLFAGLAFHRAHLMSALLCLEGMMLIIFLGISLWPSQLALGPIMSPLITLTMSACEAGMGLSLMVAMTRSHNKAELTNLNSLKW